MKKKVLIFGFVALLAATAHSQVIDASNFNKRLAFVDTFQRANLSSVSVASTGSNQVWNYGGITNNGFGLIEYFDASDSITGYPPVYHYSYLELVSPSGGQIDAYQFNALDNDGYTISALYVNAYSESLTPLSGGPNDVLAIPGQRYTFPETFYYLKFPVNNQSTWISNYTRRVNFNLTLAGFGLNQTPGYFQVKEIETRTVVGDGQIIIPDENGNPMPPVDVFMIEAQSIATDSIFLAGAPAPSALLGAFGIPQGDTSIAHYYLFYSVSGAGEPVASYSVDANGSIVSFTYRPAMVREIQSMGLAEEQLNQLNAYPNPTSGVVTLSHAVNSAGLYNVQGQKLMNISGQTFDMSALPRGIYILQIDNQTSLRLMKD